MPAGIHAEQALQQEAQAKSDAKVRREEAKAQLDAESAAEAGGEGEAAPSLSGTTAIEGEGSVRASEDTTREVREGLET